MCAAPKRSCSSDRHGLWGQAATRDSSLIPRPHVRTAAENVDASECVEFFPTLGVHPAFGRFLNPNDDSEAAPPAVVVSYRFWQNVLGSDHAAIGESILVGKAPFTIVGVAPRASLELDPGVPRDFWVPLSFRPAVAPYFANTTAANSIWLLLMARLRPGVSVAQAASAISVPFAASTTNGPEAIFAPSDAPRIEVPSAAHG